MPNGADGIVARLLECNNHPGHVEFHCVRNPKRATLVDAQGCSTMEAVIDKDVVQFDVAAADLVHLQIEFA